MVSLEPPPRILASDADSSATGRPSAPRQVEPLRWVMGWAIPGEGVVLLGGGERNLNRKPY